MGRLLGLALAVLLMHLLLLQGAPARFSVTAAQAPVRLLTRSLPAPDTTPPPVATTAAPARTAPSPRPAVTRPATRTVAPATGPTAAQPVISEQNVALASASTEEIATKSEAPAAPEPPASAVPHTAHAASAAPAASAAAVATAAHPAHSAGPVQVPPPVRLRYLVKGEARGLHYNAAAELLWQPAASHYEARLEVTAFLLGSRVQTSSGRITPQGLAPTRFADKGRSEQAAHFEREKGHISFSANTPDVPLQPGAQDRLSVVLQLASLLAGNPGHYPPGTQIALQTAGPRDADVWQFTVEGPERLELPGGTVTGTRLVRLPRREYDQKVELWFSESHNFLPVRIKLTQVRGDYVDQLWQGSETP